MSLGVILQKQKQIEPARHAYEQAISADPKFVNPLLQLALLDADAHDWKSVADLADRAMDMDPIDFPEGFFYSAVAHFNLWLVSATDRQLTRQRARRKLDWFIRADMLTQQIPHLGDEDGRGFGWRLML